ncbi:hypothetical protein KI387_008116, partial [Taxus chinensis]
KEEPLKIPPTPLEFEEGNASLIEDMIDINIKIDANHKILNLGSLISSREVEVKTKILKDH